MTDRHPTDDLIRSLSLNLRPVPRGTVALRLTVGVAAGTAISVVLLLSLVGARPDLAYVLSSAGFWSKAAYMLATAAISLTAATRLARPEAELSILWLLPLPFLLYLPMGFWELAHTNQSQWVPMLLGYGWKLCTWLVLFLSIPVYVGLWWAFRSFAPTQIEATGAVAGLCASAIAAVVYCLHCPTDTAVFALAWYTLAFAIASSLGSVLARRLMRW